MIRLPFADHEHVAAAAAAADEVLRAGGVVLLPTETFYGLAVDPTNAEAVQRVHRLKDRPPQMALPVLCADWKQLEALVEVPTTFRVRLSRTWPGPLTVVLPCATSLPAAPAGTVAVRIPGLARLRALLYRTGAVTGTSANRHGHRSCTDPDRALASLTAAPDLVLDGGATIGGLASTLVDLSGPEPRVLRPGAASWV